VSLIHADEPVTECLISVRFHRSQKFPERQLRVDSRLLAKWYIRNSCRTGFSWSPTVRSRAEVSSCLSLGRGSTARTCRSRAECEWWKCRNYGLFCTTNQHLDL